MVVNRRELMSAIAVVANEQNLRCTVKQTGKGALVCGTGAFIGGILLGPLGLAVGSTVGGLAAYNMTKGTFRPLADVLLNDLNDDQCERLVHHITQVIRDFEITDIALLAPLLMSNVGLQQAVLKTAISFISNEMNLQIA